MNTKKLFFLAISAVLLLIACNTRQPSSYELTPSVSYSFDTVENTRYHRTHTTFCQNGKDWIVSFAYRTDLDNNEMVYYCRDKVDSSKWYCSETRVIPYFDNQKVLPMYSFSNSNDSIFVSANYKFYVVYTNTDRSSYLCYIDTIDGNQIDIDRGFLNMIFLNNMLYTGVYHSNITGYPMEILQEYFSSTPIGKFGSEDGVLKLEATFGQFPEIYKKDFYHQWNPAYLATDSQYLYATFIHDHNVYIYDDTTLAAIKPMRSHKMKDFKPADFNKNSPTDIASYWITNYRYGPMYYDPYRQLFYRQALYPSPEYLNDNLKTRQKLQNWDLLIFDKGMNLVGSHYFTGDEYLNYVLVVPEGLLVQRYGNENLEMQLFKVKKQ